MNKKDIAKHYISTECKIKLAIKKMGKLNTNNFCLVLGKQKNILGTITDGDIRRMLGDISDVTKVLASDIMCENPKKILSNSLAVDAMELIQMNNITQVIVVNEQGYYKGMLHLHELIKEGISE